MFILQNVDLFPESGECGERTVWTYDVWENEEIPKDEVHEKVAKNLPNAQK